jgi:hypothetical protein
MALGTLRDRSAARIQSFAFFECQRGLRDLPFRQERSALLRKAPWPAPDRPRSFGRHASHYYPSCSIMGEVDSATGGPTVEVSRTPLKALAAPAPPPPSPTPPACCDGERRSALDRPSEGPFPIRGQGPRRRPAQAVLPACVTTKRQRRGDARSGDRRWVGPRRHDGGRQGGAPSEGSGAVSSPPFALDE